MRFAHVANATDDAINDLQAIYNELATLRAKACRAALIEEGVPAKQLTFRGEGLQTELKVDFIPRGDPSGVNRGVPLPAGIPFRLRLASSGVEIHRSVTDTSAVTVPCPLPTGAALCVAQDYLFEALGGVGTLPASLTFHISPELDERDVVVAELLTFLRKWTRAQLPWQAHQGHPKHAPLCTQI